MDHRYSHDMKTCTHHTLQYKCRIQTNTNPLVYNKVCVMEWDVMMYSSLGPINILKVLKWITSIYAFSIKEHLGVIQYK